MRCSFQGPFQAYRQRQTRQKREGGNGRKKETRSGCPVLFPVPPASLIDACLPAFFFLKCHVFVFHVYFSGSVWHAQEREKSSQPASHGRRHAQACCLLKAWAVNPKMKARKRGERDGMPPKLKVCKKAQACKTRSGENCGV